MPDIVIGTRYCDRHMGRSRAGAHPVTCGGAGPTRVDASRDDKGVAARGAVASTGHGARAGAATAGDTRRP
ncbi:hypothetical protein GCM10022214_81220 [Actinomadura miaoliensis]|uniref:Uncharacterized protein n=1 Tax=Actinomadura miaoliensis TaxID=430685 RepID=A0ABP7X3B7_9ACTN